MSASAPRPRASVLTSDVHNEGELLFHLLEHPDKHCVSKLDMLTLLRGMGMNPTDADLEDLFASMQPLVAEYEAMVREEEARNEKERLKNEAKLARGRRNVIQMAPGGKAIQKMTPGGKSARGNGKGAAAEEQKEEEEDPRLKAILEPVEEMKNIDWHIFIHSLEPVFKDSRQEEREVLNALAVFDEDGLGRLTMDRLVEILTTHGESILSPAEVKQLRETFTENTVEFKEFAKRLQGTWVPPPPPTAEELAAKAEAERILAAKAREAAVNDIDALLANTAVA
jgi:Ca2+-binding EF-hand superfamily protein